jgi:outer membrane receptor protein involved in Fe transport
VKFDIPAQAAPEALQLFIKQSGTQVMFVADEVKTVTTKAVAGEHEPAAALALLLDGSGYTCAERKSGWFTVVRAAVEKPGSIEGVVRSADSGRGVAGARVEIAGTEKSVLTDKRGRFVLEEAPTGDQELHITAEGMQNTKVTDLTVKPGHRHTLSSINIPVKPAGVVQLDTFVVSAKKNDGVVELDPFSVEGRREKPFTTANVDVPRTVNDVQPYYIFDSKAIDRSGALNVEDLLKQQLTMNTAVQSNSQNPGAPTSPNTSGNTSDINLRGLGTDSTLILVNGRRVAGVGTTGTSLQQPDLNGIPLSAIERIEVMPSSASGIYGGSAIGGVVNVILKKDYTGGEIRATYENTWDTDAPRRSVSLNYGAALEGGKTHITLSAAWADSKDLRLQDRRELLDRGVAAIFRNLPSYLYSNTNPFLGALPNITANTSAATTLTLKSGAVIPSRRTFIPAGTSPSTARATLDASLIANAGLWNFDLPVSTQANTGLLRPLGVSPETRSFAAGLRREFGPKVEIFADFSRNENRSATVYNPNSGFFVVSNASPANPFTSAVRIRIPDSAQLPLTSESISLSFTVGAIAKLPWDWTGELDYTRSQNKFSRLNYLTDTFALNDDLNSGVLNPFIDTLMFPLDLKKYTVPNIYRGSSKLDDMALRGSGPLPSLPWGTPNLTLGLEHRVATTPENTLNRKYPVSTLQSYRYTFFEREDVTDSAYGEVTLPLVKPASLSWVHALELQLAGRTERYTADTGSSYALTYFERSPAVTIFEEPTLNGQPYRTRTRYVSTNTTVGLKYQPVPDITLRSSIATAFLPPYPFQLIRNPLPDPFPSTVTDPRTNTILDVETISGGNPDLKPQNSKSWNAGLIWQPSAGTLKGLRFNAEYYRIEQFDAVGYLSAQQIVDQEAAFPGRVTRNASGTITRVDTTNVNVYRLETEGFDLNVSYRKPTSWGVFSVQAAGSLLRHLKTQYSLTDPEYDGAGFPADGGAAKFKSNVALGWEKGNWTAGWSARYFGDYKQFGAAGGPLSIQYAGGAVYSTPVAAQGSEIIPSQTYHDVFASYSFGKTVRSDSKWPRLGTTILTGMTIQVGVKNIFGKLPPYDANYAYYTSPYGDLRLRSYSLSVRKEF